LNFLWWWSGVLGVVGGRSRVKLNGLARNAVVYVRFERDLEGGGRGIACEPPLPVDQYRPSRVKEA